ncbi:patatin family protein [Prevotella sp. KH2C16]|uniref:patatin-like phospholipase family protein n=1 Tax=Prevotella sp. KH2C16 TaxID=1855325 RepID=UPI0008F3B3E9|nr:patatin family protein [Prevotella sp. KH2C16]SFF86236.1 Predicted phospholipase, patatin/cPLA2 family [Prevotella sp. KH2C16]
MTGLVLEGGALRGLFSAGCLDVMIEHGIQFDGMIGVSAGAAFGCNYKSRQPGRVIRYNQRFAKDWRFCSLRSLLTTGDLFGAEFGYHYMPEKLDIFDAKAFEDNPMEFYVVCSDIDTGKPVYRKIMKGCYEAYEWIRASASMPVAARPVELEGYRLLDGGITDSIPLKFFEGIGYTRNIVIETQPRDYAKTPYRMFGLMKAALHRYPALVEAMRRRPQMYNAQKAYVRRQEADGMVLVLRPEEKLKIGHISHDPKEMMEAYQTGRNLATRRLAEIKKFVNGK